MNPVKLAFILSVCSLSLAAAADEQPRDVIPLVNWEFAKEKTPGPLAPPADADWKPVTIPHIFRQSGLPDEAAGWYRLKFDLKKSDEKRRIYLLLEGAATVKDVYINGVPAGQHKGSFTASAFDLTPGVRIGQPNVLDVRVSNRDEETKGCLGRSTLYYVNGGIFRKAWLVKTGAVHIFPESGSSGVFLTPSDITADKAVLGVRTVVRNPLDKPVRVRLLHRVSDPDGKVCAEFGEEATVPAGQTLPVSGSGVVAKPVLWDLGKPVLYTVRTELQSEGAPSDAVTEQTGFRTIELKDGCFLLNGREVQFQGVNKHAQDEYVWNAVPDEVLRREWDSMIDMGANAVRLAHYPHSSLEYDIADKRGVAVWAENGFAGHSWKGAQPEDKVVTPDGERLTREMVRQNWNHPSILFWSVGNETIATTASHYARVIRGEDPSRLRLVTYAANGAVPTDCDFVAWNTYDGWYSGNYDGFAALPRNRFVSETGCGDWITHHIPHGVRKWSVNKFEPEEYAEMFTEYRLQTICRNDKQNRPLFFWWNFREFYDKKFKANRNTKGLVTLGGLPKDAYYLFQAFMNKQKPVVHLCERQHFLRRFAPDNGIKAYSNAAKLTLTLNGVDQGTLQNGAYRIPDIQVKDKAGKVTDIKGIPVENVFFWKAPLKPGRNVVRVSDDKGNSDEMIVYQAAAESLPADAAATVQDLKSSNPANPALFIDRPVEAQSAFFSEVDGTSDNTFDVLPKEVKGAAWITTKRTSAEGMQTDLSFRIHPDAKAARIFVLFSTGTHPAVTLLQPDEEVTKAAGLFRKSLAENGFSDTGTKAVWRDQMLNRSDAELWSRVVKPGEQVTIPGQKLDYVIMVKPEKP